MSGTERATGMTASVQPAAGGEIEEFADRLARRSVSVPTTGASAAVVRHQVRAAAVPRGVSREWIEELVLAVDEAFSNAVRHGTGTATDLIEVVVESDRVGISVSLCYRGEPFDTRVRELPSDMYQLGGRGRFLMRQLLDAEEFRFSSGNTLLRMFKRY